MHATAVNATEAMNLKEDRDGYLGRFGRRKGREKCGDYLINLKIKSTDSTANYLGSVLSKKIL